MTFEPLWGLKIAAKSTSKWSLAWPPGAYPAFEARLAPRLSQTLELLDLSQNCFGDEGVSHLASQLPKKRGRQGS